LNGARRGICNGDSGAACCKTAKDSVTTNACKNDAYDY
jgi:hypothetical protein